MAMKVMEAVKELRNMGVPVQEPPLAFANITKVPSEKYETPSGKVESIEFMDEIHYAPSSTDSLTDTIDLSIKGVPFTGALYQIEEGFMRFDVKDSQVTCATEGVPEEYEGKIETVTKKLGIARKSMI
jgi:hypothetical protein